MPQTTSGFVGRSADLDQLRRAVDDAVAGSGSLVLLSGEPGIGKTRLTEEVAAHATLAGAVVHRGAGWEGGGAPAYWPWIQILRSCGAELEADAEGEQARFRMFDAVCSLLRRRALEQPVVLVLDDLHWADVGSLLLLRFLGREARTAPILALGAARDAEVDAASDVGRSLAELSVSARTLHLSGLTPPEVRELLTESVGPHEAQRLADDVHHRSGGNPLFVRELGRLLVTPSGLGASVPGSLRAVLHGRLSRLPDDCLRLLRVCAAAGEEFRVDVVSGSPQPALDLLDLAVRARLVHALDQPGRLAFSHALVRDALYDELSLPERADVHRRIGEALERVPDDPPLAELAHHFLRAGDPRGAEYSEKAGARALSQLAYEDAADHFTRTLAASTDDEQRARVWLLLGEARMRAGDVDAAREAFERSAAIGRRAGRPELIAHAALAFGAGLDGIEIRLFDRAQIDLLEEALGALPAEDSAMRAWTMARLSVALTLAEIGVRRKELADGAVNMARRVGDPRALAYAIGAYCDAFAGPDSSEHRCALASEAVGLCIETGDRRMELLARRNRLIAFLECGDIAAVDAEIDAYAATAETLHDPLYLWYVPMWRAMRALMVGRVDECAALTEEVDRIGARAHSQNAEILTLVLRWLVLREEGRAEEATEVMRTQIALTPGLYGESFWIALQNPRHHPEDTKAALARVAPNDFAELPRDAVWLACMCHVTDSCAVVRDTAVARDAYRILLPYANRFAVDGTATGCYGSMSRYLGVLAGVLGRDDDAARHFEDALAANRRAGATALVAHTLRAMQDVRPPATNAFRRDGEIWTLAYDGRSVALRDAKGLHDIAALIAACGREIHVADLMSVEAAPASDPMLDDSARSAYRIRLHELQDDLDEAERFGDTVRASRAREEMDAIAGQLASALGLGGRARGMDTGAERVRKAVAQRVRNAIKRIDAAHPALARHLDASLRMGTFCSYTPERDTPWVT